MGLFVDSNNKMSVARQLADAELQRKEKNKKRFKILQKIKKFTYQQVNFFKKGVKIKDVKDKKTQQEVNQSLSQFVNVLSAYINEHGDSC